MYMCLTKIIQKCDYSLNLNSIRNVTRIYSISSTI